MKMTSYLALFVLVSIAVGCQAQPVMDKRGCFYASYLGTDEGRNFIFQSEKAAKTWFLTKGPDGSVCKRYGDNIALFADFTIYRLCQMDVRELSLFHIACNLPNSSVAFKKRDIADDIDPIIDFQLEKIHIDFCYLVDADGAISVEDGTVSNEDYVPNFK